MSVIAIIEISNPDELIAAHGAETYKFLHDALVDRLRGWVRQQDKLVVDKSGRVCALLKGVTDQGQIKLAANKLMTLTQPLYDCFGQQVRVPVYAGFAQTQAQGDTREAALARASAALRRAQANNTGWETYRADESAVKEDEYKLLQRLQNAVDCGEFVLFFQPKVNAAYRTLTGAEALIRWSPDGKQIITPDKFIDVAERHEIIKPISMWATKSAIARCARWTGDTGVSVNLPPTVLQDDDLFATVEDTLSLYNIEASRVTLEVTESVMADNFDLLFENLSRLRALGVRISIDDFGTGYSSLAYFRNLPADEIKIDRCFVMAMGSSQMDLAIVKSIIDLARNFSLKVVAEGVEDEATADTLLEMGCDTLQGYFFDKPLPPEDLEMRHQLIG